ncbi:hypothetical protein CSUI_006229, partial [Cystoisospora suis]
VRSDEVRHLLLGLRSPTGRRVGLLFRMRLGGVAGSGPA